MTTLCRLPSLGKKIPRCYEYLGRLLALLDQIACRAWGCPGTEGGHTIHRLLGRAVSNGNAGVELAFIGQYDESLANARAIGEVANLLWLFSIDRSTIRDWKSLKDRERWWKYRPTTVRKKILGKGEPLLIEEDSYSLLSERAVHVTPVTAPNTLDIARRPSLGGVYREEMLLLSLNEIAFAVGVLSLPTVNLLGPAKSAIDVLTTGKTLINSVGGVRLQQVSELLTLKSLSFP